jgi:choice-of-anchor B domain-containing protein
LWLLALLVAGSSALAAVPPEVENVQLDGSAVLWDAVPEATMYRAVRSSLSALPVLCGAGYALTADNFFFDFQAPPFGEGYAYVMSALEAGEEGTLGQTSAGSERSILLQCDSDNDLVLDVADNCPFDGNANQQDADGDLVGDACDFDAWRVSLRSRIPLKLFPGSHLAGNDLWHYVSPGGQEYAIIGLQKGVAFVRVTDPLQAAVVGYIDGAGSSTDWRAQAVYGHHAYLVGDQVSTGLQIVNLSGIDANQVTLVNTTDLGIGFTDAHNIAVNESSGTLFLALPNTNLGRGITAVDLTVDPADPDVVGTWDPGPGVRCHDLQAVSYFLGPYAGKEFAFCFAENDGLRIVDVTDKALMSQESALAHPPWRYVHQGWLSPDRRFLYLNDELDEVQNTVATTTTYVVDVQDLALPSVLTTFTTGLDSIDHNLMTREDKVYEANYSSGLRVFNTCDLADIHEVGYFDTYPEDDSQNYVGAWGVSTQLPSGTVIVSDIQRGLFVLDALPADVDVGRRCVAGGDVDPACDSCVAQVCGMSPNCCSNWNGKCVEMVRTVCGSLVCDESAGGCLHPLCEEGGPLAPGCDVPPAASSCVQDICNTLPDCCISGWSEACVAAVASVCGANCE